MTDPTTPVARIGHLLRCILQVRAEDNAPKDAWHVSKLVNHERGGLALGAAQDAIRPSDVEWLAALFDAAVALRTHERRLGAPVPDADAWAAREEALIDRLMVVVEG